MAFCLLAGEPIEDGIKRIVSEEMDQAIKDIDSVRVKRSEAIHEVRKHCKRARGVLRLVRPHCEETYRLENTWFRDTAKGIAELRDGEALIETFDDLLAKFSDQIDRRTFAHTRRALINRRKEIFVRSGDVNQKLKALRARMNKATARVPHWKLKIREFDGIEEGLVATYRRARETMDTAYCDPTPENFHEWRKQAKYHDFHIILLRELWRPVMRSLSKQTDELSDLLGDDHNLDVLHRTLAKTPKKYGKKRDIQVLLGLIDRRSAELRLNAHTIGARILAEKPAAFGRRFRGYWKAWRTDTELPSKKLSEAPATVTASA